MIYGFISDVALINRVGVVEKLNAPDTDVGFFDDNMANYFMSPAAIRDMRALRQILGAAPAPAMPGMKFNFDADETDPVDFDLVDAGELGQLFNIIEVAALSQGLTVGDLDTAFQADSSAFGIYDPGSLELAGTAVLSTLTLSNGTVLEAQNVRSWIKFGVSFDGGAVVEFKLWYSSSAFMLDYPISNIVMVVPPCDPAFLLNPQFANTVDAVAKAISYSSQQAAAQIAAEDHSGILRFGVGYNNANYGSSAYNMIFQVLYKGAQPNNVEARVAVRLYLADTGLGDESDWMALFPSLFNEAKFWLVPMWDNPHATDLALICGIYPVTDFLERLAELYPTYDSSDLETYARLLKSAASEAYIAALPDEENEPSHQDLQVLHGTYQLSPVDNQTMSSETQEFHEKLGQAIAVAAGTTENIHGMLRTTVGGQSYIVFTVDDTEYYLLTKPGV